MLKKKKYKKIIKKKKSLYAVWKQSSITHNVEKEARDS